jgi:hypothetical protein
MIWLMDNEIVHLGLSHQTVINDPAILLDNETGTMLKWGNMKDVEKHMENLIEADSTGIISGHLAVIRFLASGLNIEEIFKVLYNCIHNCDYAGMVYEKLLRGEDIRVAE